MTLGQRLKKTLINNNISATELCKRTGIPKSAMSQYINGKFEPRQNRVYLIAKALNVSEAWLMGYDLSAERKEEKHTLQLSEHEEKVIGAYREQPEMQKAVDKLLNIE